MGGPGTPRDSSGEMMFSQDSDVDSPMMQHFRRVREDEEFTYFNDKILSFYQILSPPQLHCGIIFSIQMAEMNIYELCEVSLTH